MEGKGLESREQSRGIVIGCVFRFRRFVLPSRSVLAGVTQTGSRGPFSPKTVRVGEKKRKRKKKERKENGEENQH